MNIKEMSASYGWDEAIVYCCCNPEIWRSVAEVSLKKDVLSFVFYKDRSKDFSCRVRHIDELRKENVDIGTWLLMAARLALA